jgi:hypothetical protein
MPGSGHREQAASKRLVHAPSKALQRLSNGIEFASTRVDDGFSKSLSRLDTRAPRQNRSAHLR